MEETKGGYYEKRAEQEQAIAKRLTALCKEKELTYKEVAEKANLPIKKVYRIMNGTSGCPNVIAMVSICKVLEITVDEFFHSEEFVGLL